MFLVTTIFLFLNGFLDGSPFDPISEVDCAVVFAFLFPEVDGAYGCLEGAKLQAGFLLSEVFGSGNCDCLFRSTIFYISVAIVIFGKADADGVIFFDISF